MKKLKKMYIALMLFFLYAPIAVLILFSFNESRSRGKFTAFSLTWYRALFQDQIIMDALKNTIIIAFLSAFFATIIGTASAVGIHAMKKPSRKILLAINNIPVMNPDIVTGISMMLLFLFIFNILNMGSMGFVTLLLSHITFNIPYVILSVLPKIRQLDQNLYEAAQDLGATPRIALTKIILPQLYPGILTGAIFAFTLSLDDFVISFFTKGAGINNLSTIIYTYAAKRGITPEINALSAIIFVTVMLLLILINKRDAEERKMGAFEE